MAKWKIAGINFDHMHMGDNLRMAFEHPEVEIVGICDAQPERMQQAITNFSIPDTQVCGCPSAYAIRPASVQYTRSPTCIDYL